jgi:hypothetical protein
MKAEEAGGGEQQAQQEYSPAAQAGEAKRQKMEYKPPRFSMTQLEKKRTDLVS